MNSVAITQVSTLIYPIMLTQQAEEISEAKAAELIGVNIETYRQQKAQTIDAIMKMVKSLPSPLILLLEGTKAQQKSSLPSE